MSENRGGRPRKYETPEQMQLMIDDYFVTLGDDKPTIAGMCYHLGFEDRGALAEYAAYEGFSPTVKRARLRVEQTLEQSLYAGQVTGVIFNLKNNFGWRDKSEIGHSVTLEETLDELE